MRLLFALIVLSHGLIHLLGFAKAFQLAEVPQLGGSFSKSTGILWLLAAVLFAASILLFFLKKDEWWMLAAPAVLLSQILIFTQWKDARFGTIANLIALAGVATGFGAWQFNRMVRAETAVFAAAPLPAPVQVTREMLAPLPSVVQAWLERSGVVGKDVIHKAHIRQTGEMRTKPDAGWLPFQAEQYNTADNPGFIWTTRIEIAPAVYLAGRDKYQDGHGQMLIRLLSLFPVADAKGPETDQGTLLRNLAEICWFPTAALSDYIHWEALDAFSARATMTWGGTTASGTFRFNADGDMTGFEAQRYYDRKEGPTLETWVVENKDWKTMNGIRIPYKSEITWKLKTGDFTWLRLDINDIEYNKP